ncbi:MAG: hypothetical protein JWO72_678 [Caulobacteraceae bacterium]|nr:hypothetical protein [Caulobacteraceae bacterium]
MTPTSPAPAARSRHRFPRLPSPLRWSAEGPGTALACLPAIALPLIVGIGLGQPAAGMVAAGGALSVGFGAFQQLSRTRALPMMLAALGMAVAALLGSVLGGHALAFAAMLAVWAGFCGLATTLGAGAWWTVLQWVLAMLVAGSRPGDLLAGLERALLVLAGGALQTLIVSLVWRLKLLPEAVTQPLPRAPLRTALRLLRRHFSLHAPTGRYALVLALSVGTLDLIARRLSLPNGYWAPLTLLILLKPAFRDTFKRGVQRILGTLAGAGVATLLVALLRPGEWVVAALVVASAFGAYTLLRVNYLAYTVFITAYVAFLLTLAGMPEPVVAADRVIGTLAGGLTALLVHAGWTASERARLRRKRT